MSLQKANITTELEQKSLIEEKEHSQNGKSKDNYNEDRKLRCFNYNIYEHMAKDCRKLKKEKEMRKYYKDSDEERWQREEIWSKHSIINLYTQ